MTFRMKHVTEAEGKIYFAEILKNAILETSTFQ